MCVCVCVSAFAYVNRVADFAPVLVCVRECVCVSVCLEAHARLCTRCDKYVRSWLRMCLVHPRVCVCVCVYVCVHSSSVRRVVLVAVAVQEAAPSPSASASAVALPPTAQTEPNHPSSRRVCRRLTTGQGRWRCTLRLVVAVAVWVVVWLGAHNRGVLVAQLYLDSYGPARYVCACVSVVCVCVSMVSVCVCVCVCACALSQHSIVIRAVVL